MSDRLSWTCTPEYDRFPVEPLKTRDGKEVGGLTVGHPFVLKCEGDTGVMRPEGILVKELKKTEKDTEGKLEKSYKLKILKVVEMKNDQSEFEVTSYSPAPFDLKGLVLTDNLIEAEIQNDAAIVLESVLPAPQMNQEGQPEEPKINAAMGPVFASPSWLFFILLGSTLFLFVAGIAMAIYRRYQRSREMEQMNELRTHLGSYQQFYKEIRKIEGDLKRVDVSNKEAVTEIIDEAKMTFDMYFCRELLLDIRELEAKRFTARLKGAKPKVFTSRIDELMSFIEEVEKLKGFESFEVKDLEGLIRREKAVIDEVHKAMRTVGVNK
jgi:hypothetical protein